MCCKLSVNTTLHIDIVTVAEPLHFIHLTKALAIQMFPPILFHNYSRQCFIQHLWLFSHTTAQKHMVSVTQHPAPAGSSEDIGLFALESVMF